MWLVLALGAFFRALARCQVRSSWHTKTAKAVFQGSRPTTWCMTPAAVAYPPLYASGGPAGGQTVAFDPREQGDGLRPKPLLHSGSVGSFQGRQGPGLRPSPGRPVSSLRCGPRQPPLRPLTPFPLEKRSGSATAAPSGWCGPQPGTGEDSGQTGRTLDAAAAARASRRGSRGGLLTPAPRRLAGESGRAEGSALCPSPQGAEQVASCPTGQRYVTKIACISYLYCVSYLY